MNLNNKMAWWVDLKECRRVVKKFLDTDKKDGVKHCHYIWHRELNAINAFDTPQQLAIDIKLKENQGFSFYKNIEIDRSLCKEFCVKRAIILVYRHTNANMNLYGLNKATNQVINDNVSCAFGYIPANCEDCITEVFF